MDLRNRLIAVLLVLGILFTLPGVPSALAEPDEPFSGSTPSFDAAPQEAINYNLGDWGVSEQNGAATYTFPIAVPPGRNGMAPSLALRYSSHSPLRGGLAAGWAFDIPYIGVDHALGVGGGEQYKVSMGNVAGRLIGNKVQFDASNTLFYQYDPEPIEPGPDHWIALTTDGVRHYFEEVASELVNNNNAHTKWRITRQVDPFGNTVNYVWSNVIAPYGSHIIDQSLLRIEYTSNAGAGLVPHAKVEFTYAPLDLCDFSNVPIGAAMRPGSWQVDGAQKLTGIQVFVRETQSSDWRLSKEIALTYRLRQSFFYDVGVTQDGDETCYQNPLRYLTQIDATAYAPDGTPTRLPPLEFLYNNRIDTGRSWLFPHENPMREITIASPGYGQAGTSGNRLAGLQTTLLDIDSDGIRDRIAITQEDSLCKLLWRKGLLGGVFEPQERTAQLPTAAWYRDWRGIASSYIDSQEGCNLSGQIAYRSLPSTDPQIPGDVFARGFLSYHFMDYTGDGRLDLLTNVWASACHRTYDPWAPSIFGDYCSFEGGSQTIGGITGVPMGPEGAPSGDIYPRFRWRVYPGTGNPDEPFLNNPVLPTRISVASPLPLPPSSSDALLDTSFVIQYGVPALFDLDGDGFLDVIQTQSTILTNCANPVLLRGCDWTVYFGDGSGSFPLIADAYVWNVPTADLASDEGEYGVCGLQYVRRRATVADLRDMNGDGLADLVVRLSDGQVQFYRSTGSEFDENSVLMGSVSPLEKTQTDCQGQLQVGVLTQGARGYLRRLVDLDGDGLLDMLWLADGSAVADITAQHLVYAQFNLGDRFGPATTLLFPEKWQQVSRLLSAAWPSETGNLFAGNWHIAADFVDVTGDGLDDLVRWQGDTLTYISSPGLPPAPDRLRRVTNGRGLQVDFSYAPSTDTTVVDWAGFGSALPYVNWVVKEVTIAGGLGTPPITTGYLYHTPRYLPIETERSRFAGFTQNTMTSSYADGRSQQTLKEYSYALNGYLIKTQVNQDGQLHQVQRQEWLHLEGVALPALSTSCTASAAGMSEAQCFAQDDNISRIEKTWELDSGVIVNRTHAEGLGAAPRPEDRRTTYDYDILIGPGVIPEDYRVQMRETLYETRDASGNFVPAGRTVTDFDAATGLPDKARSYLDAATPAETDFEHDGQTGNLVSLQKPVQAVANGGSGRRTTYTYDSHALFVYRTTSELGHQVHTTYDVATGVLIKREGPNRIDPLVEEHILEPVADTYVSEKDPQANFGQETQFYAGHEQGSCSGNYCRMDSLLKFDAAPIAGKTVVSARLRLHVEQTSGMQYPVTLSTARYGPQATWTESGATYFNYPENTGMNGGFCDRSIPAAAEWAEWSCSSLGTWVQDWADGSPNNGLALKRRETYGARNAFPAFASRENAVAAHRPQLVVTAVEGVLQTIYETQTWQIDGLGRQLGHSVSFDDPALGYVLVPLQRITYEDWNFYNTGAPNWVRSESLRDRGGSVWVTGEQTLDGLGRALASSQLLDGGARAETAYTYDERGNLAAVTQPDPSGANPSVTFTYQYDALGRVIRFDRPDGSGVEISYTGLSKTISEITSDGSGGSQTQVFDALGRMAELREHYPDLPDAVTQYAYDATDNISRITDADGQVTTMLHNWVGNRVAITRGDRTWTYTYDLNGNQTEELPPLGGEPVRYTYDDLDRLLAVSYADPVIDVLPEEPLPQPEREWPIFLPMVLGSGSASAGESVPSRGPVEILPGLSAAPGQAVLAMTLVGLLAALGFALAAMRPRPWRLWLDRSVRTLVALGLLLPSISSPTSRSEAASAASSVDAKAAVSKTSALDRLAAYQTVAISYAYDEGHNAIGRLSRVDLPFGQVAYTYDARGQPTREERSFTLTGIADASAAQVVDREYNALGMQTRSTWDDGQQWQISYDERALVDTVEWLNPGTSAWEAVADYARGLSGLPQSRSTDYGQSRSFSYDVMGRPTSEVVAPTGGGNAIAERAYVYSQAGDLVAVTGQTGGVPADAGYTYDAHHRLLSASGPNGYQGAFTYSPAGNILTAAVNWYGSREARNVRYEYGAVDPQAVDRLLNAGSNRVYAGFEYDASGNMTWRDTPAGAAALAWDGLDQIRMVHGANGAEVYLYDHSGARMLAVNRQEGVRFWFGESETHYTLDGAQTRRYLHLSGGGATLARLEDGAAVELQYADALQNLMLSLGADGTQAAGFQYGPFGEVVSASGDANHRRQFNGKENDALSGLRYYGYRYYDPLTLRWVSADPLYRFVPDIGLEEPQRMNLYAFSLNNPLRYYDPDGYSPFAKYKQDFDNLSSVVKGYALLDKVEKAKPSEFDKIERELSQVDLITGQDGVIDDAFNQMAQAALSSRKLELVWADWKLSPEQIKERIEYRRRVAKRILERHITHFSRLLRGVEARMDELEQHRDELLKDLEQARKAGDEEWIALIEQEVEAAAEEYDQLEQLTIFYKRFIAQSKNFYDKIVEKQ